MSDKPNVAPQVECHEGEEAAERFTEAMRAALESASDGEGPDTPAGDRPDTASPAAEAADAPGPDADRPDAQASRRGAPGGAPAGAPGEGAPAGAAPGDGAPAGAAPESDAIDAVSLGATVGRRALGRLVRQPAFWFAVVVAAVILWLIVR